jgi:glycerophosphoryl diester phosphodiesterase
MSCSSNNPLQPFDRQGHSQVILSQEPFFNHDITTKPDGLFVSRDEEKSLNLFQMKYEDIKKYDVGMKPNPRFPKQMKNESA